MKTNRLSKLIISIMLIILTNSCSSTKNTQGTQGDSFGNMVAIMEVKKPIEGVCDNSRVIAILPFPGNKQVKAKAPKTNDELMIELNSKVSFLKDNPNFEGKGMVNLIINCKGELVRCEIDNKTKSTKLDNQIVAVFAEMKKWTAGSINNESVDTSVLYSFTIKNGKISL